MFARRRQLDKVVVRDNTSNTLYYFINDGTWLSESAGLVRELVHGARRATTRGAGGAC